jgi:hypothetical protein
MADLSDVENVLAMALTQLIYPNGTSQPSITGDGCKIYRGWPIPANLDADLAAEVINVSVFPLGNETNVTRYQRKWFDLPANEIELYAHVSANTITIIGTPSSPLNVTAIVNGKAYIYPVQPSDTSITIATGLASLINFDIPATSSGPVVTIEGSYGQPMHLTESGPLKKRFGGSILASMAAYWRDGPPASPLPLSETGPLNRRFGGAIGASMAGYWPVNALHSAITGLFGKRFGGAILASMGAYWPAPSVGITTRIEGVGSVIREVCRQKRSFQLTFWCATAEQRDAIAPPCDKYLKATDYLTLPDGMQARLRYERSAVSDKGENEALYRRDLIYSVEYGTTQTINAPKVTTQKAALSGGLDPNAPVIKTFFN